ncbi:endolytic transglycosylase MltG [Sporolactobacillus spathodeae]|nr:endolytic transglycosylase MltG [Sporolactobacillus spathodeae]
MKKFRWRLAALIAAALIILAAISAWSFAKFYGHELDPVKPSSHQPVTVEIKNGSTISDIAHLLEEKQLIRSAWAFEFYARWNHVNTYRSGTYTFDRSLSVGKIINDLKTGAHRSITLVIDVRQGMWVAEIAPKIAEVTGSSKQQVLQQMADRNYVQKHFMNKYPFLTKVILNKGVRYPLEGYLAPGTYSYTKGKGHLTLQQVIDPMLEQTGKTLHVFSSKIAGNSLGSVHRILTMASMVEQEAPGTQDRRKIAGVLYNRLKKKMRLQTDPSVAYGEQKQVEAYSHHDFRKDYKKSNPYNTYTHDGLPVGPIGSPAVDAIQAVLNPIHSQALFFYARPNGKIYYSATYAEHQKIVQKYQNEWSNQ